MSHMCIMVNVHRGGVHRNVDNMVQWYITTQLLDEEGKADERRPVVSSRDMI